MRPWPARTGADTARRTDARQVDLTPHELAIARLVAADRTNREVAAELIVSPKTVEYHHGRLFATVGVRSRTELAARLAATG